MSVRYIKFRLPLNSHKTWELRSTNIVYAYVCIQGWKICLPTLHISIHIHYDRIKKESFFGGLKYGDIQKYSGNHIVLVSRGTVFFKACTFLYGGGINHWCVPFINIYENERYTRCDSLCMKSEVTIYLMPSSSIIRQEVIHIVLLLRYNQRKRYALFIACWLCCAYVS